MKNIVICCDGTWNTPDERDFAVPVPTNVVRIYNAAAEFDANGVKQHRYYHPGVGTRACGLRFAAAMVDQVKPDHQGVMHDSCAGAFILLPSQPRSAPLLSDEKSSIHPSARNRQKFPPIHQCPYREDKTSIHEVPTTIDVFATQPWNATGIWLTAGKTYTFEASGEWMDGSVTCGPGGSSDGHFQLAELPQVLGSMLGAAEQLFKKITRNQAADFRFTRRHENMPWFCLVGTVANGGGVDDKDHLESHESFMIGKKMAYAPRRSGYFYAYANDAWNCYGNNRGRVSLTIA